MTDTSTSTPDDTTRRADDPCPDCGAAVPVDPRFATWCAECGWNTDSAEPDALPGRIGAHRVALARRHGEQLHAELAGGGDQSPRRDAHSVLAYALACAVHLFTVALAAIGLLLVVLGWDTVVEPIIGVILLVVAFALRPRLGRLPGDGVVLRRADAPALFTLLDQVAEGVSTRAADAVIVDVRFNASVQAYGWRRRRRVDIGLPLWETLTAQQRVALLGHEFGHYANGDTRHGLVVHTALRSLVTWYEVFTPARRNSRMVRADGLGELAQRAARPPAEAGLVRLAEALADALMVIPRYAVLGVLRLLDHLTVRSAQRAEYLADRMAAGTGSSEAAVGLFDRLLTGESVSNDLRTQAVRARTRLPGVDPKAVEAGLWTHLATRITSIPAREYDRLRRVSVLRGHAVDATHPPTHLRRSLIADGAQLPGTVVLDAAAVAAIDAELAPARTRLARDVVRDL
ncbi:M48 family metallopeptidase [Streptomyces sp. H39-S7]|uniref:M48 family metallopeptidase n=1 Tax=Streptomyces sp. H39-S7 TaxID=3004357 RepID=UPI0022AF927E|nr:M48 family metallopeptidase [Streptomyces sp. H39-S7]MCZ4119182.1 M48 family metallopeptidase [Streptomyces sp. H39-S7]